MAFYGTIFFRAKMILLILALANILIFSSTLGRRVGEWEQNPSTPAMAKLAASYLWSDGPRSSLPGAPLLTPCRPPEGGLQMFFAALLKTFCEWCNNSFFGTAVRNSRWLFPFVEIFHLLALGLLAGTILLINLRTFGLRFRNNPVSEFARELQPWMIDSLAVILASGFLLFSSEALRMYFNPAFRLKMTFLILAILFTFTL